ncbi:hypothetical protein BO70DRAFT_77546 [Aspergillus heteromorphus CBS 117.55]|uniref:Uncharacterized protein n=1 Tax=Aspergillus heteromorphus CBS 117.55 TaxID=1448321 RepID=A0A317X1D0_9EURO|nr:uncharacterized protein BO70DRAFT_77546 [Aspergillus heteromorphus CBS 117.55]PWY90758.1 hypothetical protein BO70DRAFT_77546 [Aspergillus heteromorphus CBS 117.55]
MTEHSCQASCEESDPEARVHGKPNFHGSSSASTPCMSHEREHCRIAKGSRISLLQVAGSTQTAMIIQPRVQADHLIVAVARLSLFARKAAEAVTWQLCGFQVQMMWKVAGWLFPSPVHYGILTKHGNVEPVHGTFTILAARGTEYFQEIWHDSTEIVRTSEVHRLE